MTKYIKALFVTIYISGYVFKQALQNSDISHLIGFRDELTGLPNRKYLNYYLRSVQDPWFVIMDCDYFKSVNDNHGHEAGDNVLKEVGEILLSVPVGKPHRWAGDEFVVICNTREEALKVCKYIKYDIQKANITASIGMAKSFSLADKKLYISKRRRNWYTC